VSYGALDDSPISVRASTMVYRNVTWIGFGVDAWLASAPPEVRAGVEAELWTLLAEEPDVLPVIARFPLDYAREAIQAVRDAKQRGKVLLV
jgi:NADPH:quinone reductase-like Zn-dependent oxidoreductase